MTGRRMPKNARPAATDAAAQNRLAVQRWDNEGGALALPAAPASAARPPRPARPTSGAAPARRRPTDTEIEVLRMRIIALEGLVLALLSRGTGAQRDAAGAMADEIRPRPGRTRHPLTLRAAARIAQVVDRARRLSALR